jgi:hypothetical protein
MSGVLDKIDQTLTSKPPKTLEEASPTVVKEQGKAKRVVDVEKLPLEDVDALRVQFAVTSEKQVSGNLLIQLQQTTSTFSQKLKCECENI